MTAQPEIDLPRLPGEPDEDYDRRLRSARARLGHERRKEKEKDVDEQPKQPADPVYIPPIGDGLDRQPVVLSEPIGTKSHVAQVEPGAPRSRTFHFVEDGLTVLGTTWVRGQEITLQEGSPDWALTMNGDRSLFDFSDDEQIMRFEKVMFREGRWPGRPALTQAEYEAQIAAAADEEQRHAMEKRRMREASVGYARA